MPVTRPTREEMRKAARDAVLSEDGRYRYQLTRDWVFAGGRLHFIMLNPSTADALEDDPTIRRCIGFARDLGYGGISVTNLYAWRATKPADLWAAQAAGEDIEGPENLGYLYEVLEGASYEQDHPVIAAWGAHAKPEAVETVMSLPGAHRLHALTTTKDGHPGHPLYLPAESRPTPWRPLVTV